MYYANYIANSEISNHINTYVREVFFRIFSQWDVETDVCMLIHCVCVLSIAEVQRV